MRKLLAATCLALVWPSGPSEAQAWTPEPTVAGPAWSFGFASPSAQPSWQGSRRSQPAQRGNARQDGPGSRGGRSQGGSDRPLLDIADDYELQTWFESCDFDNNGWISYHESETSLRFTKSRFRSFDPNEDGRIDKSEFVAYYRHAYKRNEFTPPRRRNKPMPPNRTAEQLLLAYDADLNRGISLSEARRIVEDYSREIIDVDTMFARIDRDQSKLLDETELGALSAAIRSLNAAPIEVPQTIVRKQVDEFFLRVIPSTGRAFPDRYVGPVTMFRRLDTDGDGKVTPGDLDNLQRTVITTLRPHTILHTLDLNQDGVLDRGEFVRAMENRGN